MGAVNRTEFILSYHDSNQDSKSQATAHTISDAKLSASEPVLPTTPKADISRYAGRKKEGVDLSNIMSESLEYLKKMLGMTPDCLNGGTKTLRGDCNCPTFYRGKLCEELICINNGTLVKVPKLVPVQYACRCPHPEYIHGTHCELVKCLNGGRPMNDGHCKCLDYWYTGQFCQEYTASWGAVLGLPLVCMVIIIICCVVCRLDLFPRKPSHTRRRRRLPPVGIYEEAVSRRHRELHLRRENNRRSNETYLQMQDNLLNENSNEPAFILRSDRRVLPPYIVRLDTVPAFNSPTSSDLNISKPLDPPPSYEQATATSFGSQSINGTNCERSVLPPHYTLYPAPPPPRFRPPDINRRN